MNNTEEINRKFDELETELKLDYERNKKRISLAKQEAIDAINKVADEALKQTPKVGDWVELEYTNNIEKTIKKVTEISGEKKYFFGIESDTNDWVTSKENKWFTLKNNQYIKSIKILTESEVIEFLSKEAEKKYKDGDNIKNTKGVTLKLGDEENGKYTGITNDSNSFCYKGIYVLDLQTGEWAEVVEKKEEDWDVEIIELPKVKSVSYLPHIVNLDAGKYKLVKIQKSN